MSESRIDLQRLIAREWRFICSDADMPQALGALPRKPKLLGGSTKTKLGNGYSILTGVVYMAPAGEAFTEGDDRTMCPGSTAACRAVCLGANSGRMIQKPAFKARLWKTALYKGAPELWRRLVIVEAQALAVKARKLGMTPAVRIDGATDTGEGYQLARMVPEVKWYDYTKLVTFAWRALLHPEPNYSITLSYSGQNARACREFLLAGGNVAIAFDLRKGEKLPGEWGFEGKLEKFAVLDGDLHDARFLDGNRSRIVGLRFKTARNYDEGVAKGGSFIVSL